MELLRLRLFGGLVLLVDDEPTTGTATQRRRLALLALLAIARDRGLSRDKVMAYLWPETDIRPARHGLNQLLSAQRRHLDAAGLFLGTKTLRLNRAVISTDVWDFEDALDNGAPEVAERLYVGPFLDGFFLQGVPEFEHWVERERDRLARRCAQALDALATAAAAAGDHRGAAEWWRRAIEVNPFDTGTTVRLVEAVVAAGDRAMGLRYAEQHAQRLRTELGLSPDARMTKLIERLRIGPSD